MPTGPSRGIVRAPTPSSSGWTVSMLRNDSLDPPPRPPIESWCASHCKRGTPARSSRSPAYLHLKRKSSRSPASFSRVRDLARILFSIVRLVHFGPMLGQVVPVRVHGLNQANLFAAAPAFDLFLAINRIIWIGERLVIDKAREIVAAGKSRNQFVLVLEHPAR